MFYSIPNLRSSTAQAMKKPWEFETAAPYDKGKEEVIRWGSDINTQHAFISGYEGLSSEVRVTLDDNPPFKMHALIVDYDGKLPENPSKYVEENPQSDLRPTYLVETISGNARLVWEFEAPMLYTNEAHMKKLIQQFSKRMQLNKWLPGLDTAALASPVKYYEIGKRWEKLPSGKPISTALLQLWSLKAAENMRFDDKSVMNYKVPLDEVAKEVEARFPGRWHTAFVEGARGVRFWDPSADNETAAVIREDGMFCFTGDSAFVSWKDIFGAAFVEKYESEHISDVVDRTCYDGNTFWYDTTGKNNWVEVNKPDFAQKLRCMNYDSSRKKGQTASEVDIIENNIKETKRVEAALPFLFFPKGQMVYNKERYLNISKVSVTEPAPPETKEKMVFSDGKKHFPLIYRILRTMFVAEEEEGSEQLSAFLAWLQFFYLNGREGNPTQGHTIVLAGPAGAGKTFLSQHVLGPLMGGFQDASDHLVDGDNWTDRIINAPIMGIDDAKAASDSKSHSHFSNRLKKYTANASMVYNQKYRRTASLPWYGRIVITCNLDADSLRILPDMDMSNKDKISLFKASDSIPKFPEGARAQALREIPAFARFLVDWEAPEHWKGNGVLRFGVRHYHHPDLFAESRQQGHGVLMELLHNTFEAYQKGHPEAEYWEGRATILYQDICTANPEAAKEIRSAKALSMALGKLAKNGYDLCKHKDVKTNLNIWKISLNICNSGEEGDNNE